MVHFFYDGTKGFGHQIARFYKRVIFLICLFLCSKINRSILVIKQFDIFKIIFLKRILYYDCGTHTTKPRFVRSLPMMCLELLH